MDFSTVPPQENTKKFDVTQKSNACFRYAIQKAQKARRCFEKGDVRVGPCRQHIGPSCQLRLPPFASHSLACRPTNQHPTNSSTLNLTALLYIREGGGGHHITCCTRHSAKFPHELLIRHDTDKGRGNDANTTLSNVKQNSLLPSGPSSLPGLEFSGVREPC